MTKARETARRTTRRRSRRPHGLRWAVGVAVLSLLPACGGGAQEVSSAQVVSSDPELERMAAELLPGLAARAGIELQRPVRVEKRSRAELEGYLAAKLDEEFPEDEADAAVRIYSMLGLVEPDLDLRGLLMDLYTEQVAGFYEPDSTALFVLDDQPREALESLLLHELVHAVQDQAAELDVLTDETRGNDRAAAAHAAIEGHATLVMLEFMMERMTGRAVDLTEVPDLAAQLLPALDGMRAQFPALARAPEIVQRSLLFPYVQGAGFVQDLWAAEGRVAPFGDYLPTSTEQIYEGDLGDVPLLVGVGVEGGTALHEDVLGRLELEVLLETHVGSEGAALARGWGGDRYALVAPDAGTDPVLAWVSVWDDVEARDRFVRGFRPGLSGLGAEASLEPMEIDGRPGALLLVGSFDGIEIQPYLEPGA